MVKESYNFNCGLVQAKFRNTLCGTWFTVDSPTVVLETVKPAEPSLAGEENDGRKIVLRLFESCGDRTHTRLFRLML